MWGVLIALVAGILVYYFIRERERSESIPELDFSRIGINCTYPNQLFESQLSLWIDSSATRVPRQRTNFDSKKFYFESSWPSEISNLLKLEDGWNRGQYLELKGLCSDLNGYINNLSNRDNQRTLPDKSQSTLSGYSDSSDRDSVLKVWQKNIQTIRDAVLGCPAEKLDHFILELTLRGSDCHISPKVQAIFPHGSFRPDTIVLTIQDNIGPDGLPKDIQLEKGSLSTLKLLVKRDQLRTVAISRWREHVNTKDTIRFALRLSESNMLRPFTTSSKFSELWGDSRNCTTPNAIE